MKTHKIKANLIFEDQRLNAGYFLNEDALNSRRLERNKEDCVFLEEIADVWNPPIFKRQFCQKTERAVQYCQSSDVTNLLEGSNTYILKSQAEKVGTLVEENQILVTGFGTIGNTKLVNKIGAGVSFANNVCRIKVTNDDFPYGFVYAFMSSKYGRSQLNKNASGSVVRYIEAPGIKKTLIPLLPKEKQAQIHQLIVDAAELRVEANRLLEEAVNIIESTFEIYIKNTVSEFRIGKSSVSVILRNAQKRIDSPVFLSESSKKIYSNEKNYKDLGALNFNVYRPGIFKRVKVKDGIPYLKGSELSRQNPFNNCEYLAKAQTPFLDELLLREEQILYTCAGSIGNTRFITKEFEEKEAIGSQDIIRIEQGSSELSIYYLFAFLNTKFSYDYIQSIKYGSVIERVEPFHVETIPILIPDENLESKIKENIKDYSANLYNAFSKEEKAISLIEKEIDLWQN